MNKYTLMQKTQYEALAKEWSLENRDPVVGSFDAHNNFDGYDEYLFQTCKLDATETALDFACGPGRNMVKYHSKFKRIDGVDISQTNIDNCKLWHEHNDVLVGTVYVCNGTDLFEISDNQYDVVFSTIAFQHICVYDIRFNYLKEVFRVLKSGGLICFQMGFGAGHPRTVGYYDNFYDALSTNSGCDVRVDSPDDIKNDLEKVGFHSFNYNIGKVGPGDGHQNWIYFNAVKV